MTSFRTLLCGVCVTGMQATSCAALAGPASGPAVPVTVDTYNRAQTDVYLAQTVKAGALGKFRHGQLLDGADPARRVARVRLPSLSVQGLLMARGVRVPVSRPTNPGSSS